MFLSWLCLIILFLLVRLFLLLLLGLKLFYFFKHTVLLLVGSSWLRGDIMVILYSGTPGSGKSLHMAERIFTYLWMGKPVVGNFFFNDALIKHKKTNYIYCPNWELTPKFLMDFSTRYQKESNKRVKEGTIKVFIDEAQLIFNSRDYGVKGRKEWLQFFTLHRHYGIDIILACQFDRMLDRQIRCLIEYEYIHRKISNFGWKGKILNFLMGGKMFACSKLWYPMKEHIGGEFFRFKKKYSKCYDTFDVNIDSKKSDKVEPDEDPEENEPVHNVVIFREA